MAGLAYRPEIDGLRAVAVLAVVLYHADASLLPGGFVGVDVFFVISGYLITRLLITEWERTGRIDFAAFYARRVRRLLPALIAMILAVLAGMLLLMGRHEALIESTAESAVASLLFVANFYFQFNTGGYFDAQAETMPMLHLWSLSVEEQFYLVYPLLMLLLLKLVPGAMMRRLAVLAIASLLLAEYWVNILPDRAFYQMPARFWELAAGGMVAMSVAPPTQRPLDRLLFPVGLAAVLLACVFTPEWGNFPGKSAVPAVAGSALILLAVHRGATGGWTAALLRSRSMVGIGLVSYSLYLWHWPLLVLDAQQRMDPATTSWRLALCLVALVLAWLSWRFVEMPFRRRRGPAAATLSMGAAATVMAAVLAIGASQVKRVPEEASRMATLARSDLPAGMDRCHFEYDGHVLSLPPESCSSISSQPPSVALWGDSHALAWKPFVWRLAESSGESAAAATMNSCHPTGMASAVSDSRDEKACDRFNRLALQWLESDAVDTLVIGLRWPLGAAEGDGASLAMRPPMDGLDAALERLGHIRRVLIMGPIPTLRRPAPDCISLGWETACARTRLEFDRDSRAIWSALSVLAERHPNVELVDPVDFFCGEIHCRVSQDGYALYWDSNHVSATAAREFGGRFLQYPSRYTPAAPATPSAR